MRKIISIITSISVTLSLLFSSAIIIKADDHQIHKGTSEDKQCEFVILKNMRIIIQYLPLL